MNDSTVRTPRTHGAAGYYVAAAAWLVMAGAAYYACSLNHHWLQAWQRITRTVVVAVMCSLPLWASFAWAVRSAASRSRAKRAVISGGACLLGAFLLFYAALPYLLASRILANETAAIARLGECTTAQRVFRTSDRYGNDRRVYANTADGNGYADLYEIAPRGGAPAVRLGLISKDLVDARSGAEPSRPRQGYWFIDIPQPDYQSRFAVCAFPAVHLVSGASTFVVDATGKVYSRDTEGAPVTAWPVEPNSGWKVVGPGGRMVR